jgi:integrase
MAGKPFKRGKEWYAIVEGTPHPETGARRQRWIHAPTRKEVLELQTKALRERDTGSGIDPTKLTLGEFVRRYYDTVARQKLRATVYQVQERYATNHIIKHLGTVPLQKLAPHHLVGWHADLAATLAPNTIITVHTILHTILEQAVRWQLAARNVCDLVDAPRRVARVPTVWDLPQIRTFLASLTDDPRDVLYATAIETGLRRSELAGLRWSDIDLARGVLAVVRAFVRIGTNAYAINDAKTPSSRRRVPLLPQTVARLRAHKSRQSGARADAGALWIDRDLVFAWHDGGPVGPITLFSHWRVIVGRSGLPYIRPHDTRHAHATLLLSLNVHPRIVQERLGHSDPGMTMRVYSHVLAGMQEDALERLGRALNATDDPAPES